MGKQNKKSSTSFLVQGSILAIASIVSRIIGLIYRIPLTNIIGDTGNDYVFNKTFKNGRDAEGYFGWTFPDGTIISWDAAVYNITNTGAGKSTEVGPLEFDVMSNGKPTITLPSGGGAK